MDATETDRHAERVERIYQAADVLREDQDEQTRRVVDWLAGWDDHTVNGVVKLLANARVCAVLAVGRRVADVMDSEEYRADRPRFDVLRQGERTMIDNPISREELEERWPPTYSPSATNY